MIYLGVPTTHRHLKVTANNLEAIFSVDTTTAVVTVISDFSDVVNDKQPQTTTRVLEVKRKMQIRPVAIKTKRLNTQEME